MISIGKSVNPQKKAEERIYSNLPDDIKKSMMECILDEEVHNKVLDNIKKASYEGVNSVESPTYTISIGQTGSGKSNLTRKIMFDNQNRVIIDSDKYKSFRPDNMEIMKKYSTIYGYVTAPDSYWHRDEMIYDAMRKKYNILMECATSMKDGMFVEPERIIKNGYNVEVAILAVSDLNSLLSVHERYEDKLDIVSDENIKEEKLTEEEKKIKYAKQISRLTAKLTPLERLYDSFDSMINVIRKIQDNNQIIKKVYIRGKDANSFPELVYSSEGTNNRFSCLLQAYLHYIREDEKIVVPNFMNRYEAIKNKMDLRNAPEKQVRQLEEVLKIFNERYPERVNVK